MIKENDPDLLAAITKAAEGPRADPNVKPTGIAPMASDGANRGLFDAARKVLAPTPPEPTENI